MDGVVRPRPRPHDAAGGPDDTGRERPRGRRAITTSRGRSMGCGRSADPCSTSRANASQSLHGDGVCLGADGGRDGDPGVRVGDLVRRLTARPSQAVVTRTNASAMAAESGRALRRALAVPRSVAERTTGREATLRSRRESHGRRRPNGPRTGPGPTAPSRMSRGDLGPAGTDGLDRSRRAAAAGRGQGRRFLSTGMGSGRRCRRPSRAASRSAPASGSIPRPSSSTAAAVVPLRTAEAALTTVTAVCTASREKTRKKSRRSRSAPEGTAPPDVAGASPARCADRPALAAGSGWCSRSSVMAIERPGSSVSTG